MRLWMILLITVFLGHALESMVRTGVEVEAYDDDDDGDVIIWAGPGWYYGIWFNDEAEYDGWRRQHGRGRYRNGHHGGRGGGRGGDRYHGGGGGHHGGGGHR